MSQRGTIGCSEVDELAVAGMAGAGGQTSGPGTAGVSGRKVYFDVQCVCVCTCVRTYVHAHLHIYTIDISTQT